MKYYLITLLFVLPQFFLFSQKEPIVLRKIEATPAVRKLAPPSLDSYLQALPVHFITYLNKTGKYAVVELDSIVSESNLDAELSYSDIFEAVEKKMIRKPKYILNCRVTAFVEKQTKMTNPLDDSIRLNRDIFVSASMQLINRDRPEDQKTFEVPEYNGQWDEDLFGTQSGGDLPRIKKIEQFAKESARQMAENFAANFEQKIYVYQKIGNQCTILSGYQNGVEKGQIYEVGIAKKIIHPITKKVMSGTTFTKIGMIEVIDTQADVSTCKIIEDLGIDTSVDPENLPLARLSQSSPSQ